MRNLTLNARWNDKYGLSLNCLHVFSCWMKPLIFYFAFLAPICAIILVNVILFALVLRGICRSSSSLRSNQDEKRIMYMQLQSGITCFVVLGKEFHLGSPISSNTYNCLVTTVPQQRRKGNLIQILVNFYTGTLVHSLL